jgi:nucleoside-diphosphate-sugar epimerase
MPRPGFESVLLVTGFPSLYARRMIEHVLTAEPSAFLYVTVDPAREMEAQAFLAAMIASKRDRVALLEGSSTSIDLGLSGAEFRQVTREVDVIHHMVHTSDADADKKTAEALNIVSASEILEIARAASALRCLVFHSTAGVSGERDGTVYEGDLDLGQTFHSPVLETRMRAERLVRKAMRDVPIAVVRPTTIVGGALTPKARPSARDRLPAPSSSSSGAAAGATASPAQGGVTITTADPGPIEVTTSGGSITPGRPTPATTSKKLGANGADEPKTPRNSAPEIREAPPPPSGGGAPFVLPPGETERLEGIYLLILLLIATPPDLTIPLPGNTGEAPLQIVPIDYVVRAAHAIGRHPTAPGRTFHIVDPRPPASRRVIELVTKASRRRAARGYVPSDLARMLLRTPGIDRFVRSPRAFLEQLMLPVHYDTRNTDAILAGTGVECPPFEAYVEELIAAVEEHVRSRRERRARRAEAEVDDPLS